jgi:nucleoside-diphosphate-sugar epimerase
MILVTGSNGLVGSHLLYHLTAQGIRVRALIRDTHKIPLVEHTFAYYTKTPQQLMELIDWAEGDVTDIYSLEKAMECIDKVYHTAAFVSFLPRHRNKIFDTNIKGTANVVNLCIEKKVNKLCFVSSIAALGQNENGEPITEDILWKPSKNISAYSLSKYHSEMEVWRGITEGLNAVIINPSVILGPGDWKKGSQAIFAAAEKGIPFYPKGTNGFVDVRDVVEGMVNAMDSDISAERFTLSAENLSYGSFLTYIAEAFNNKPPTKKVNNLFLSVVQKLEFLRSVIFNCEPRITSDMVTISQHNTYYSNQKSKDKLRLNYKSIKDTIGEISSIYKMEKKTSQQ